ncbi:MAG: LysE family transporter [Pyrobaculum sp.]
MLDLALKIMAITPSGAFSPGPLTASAVALGSSKGWRAGMRVALGHTLFELPYVAALTYLFAKVDVARYKAPLAASAFLFILFFAYLLLRDAYSIARGAPPALPKARFANPLAAGLALTALNPYFLMWWATVALPVVSALASRPWTEFVVVYAAHVWMDYLWLGLMALLGNTASKLLSAKAYAVFLAALAAALIYFGVALITSPT